MSGERGIGAGSGLYGPLVRMVPLTAISRGPGRTRDRSMERKPRRRWGPALVAAALSFLPGLGVHAVWAEDGYDLWLRYRPLAAERVPAYRARATELVATAEQGPVLAAARSELRRGLGGLLGAPPPLSPVVTRDGAVVIGSARSSPLIARLGLDLDRLGPEGYLLRSMELEGRTTTVIAAPEDIGVLY
ncbi:MAG: hypothetical protein EOP92_30320, partial [Lysobacteraceae bacterium]